MTPLHLAWFVANTPSRLVRWLDRLELAFERWVAALWPPAGAWLHAHRRTIWRYQSLVLVIAWAIAGQLWLLPDERFANPYYWLFRVLGLDATALLLAFAGTVAFLPPWWPGWRTRWGRRLALAPQFALMLLGSLMVEIGAPLGFTSWHAGGAAVNAVFWVVNGVAAVAVGVKEARDVAAGI